MKQCQQGVFIRSPCLVFDRVRGWRAAKRIRLQCGGIGKQGIYSFDSFANGWEEPWMMAPNKNRFSRGTRRVHNWEVEQQGVERTAVAQEEAAWAHCMGHCLWSIPDNYQGPSLECWRQNNQQEVWPFHNNNDNAGEFVRLQEGKAICGRTGANETICH